MIVIEDPPGFVVRTEAQKAASDNGFRIERGIEREAGPEPHLEIGAGASRQIAAVIERVVAIAVGVLVLPNCC